MAGKKNKKGRGKNQPRNLPRQVAQKDTLSYWVTLMPAVSLDGASSVYSIEVPLTPMNFNLTTDLVPAWGIVKRWRMSNLKISYILPSVGGGKILVGWNKTPGSLKANAVDTDAGFFEALDKPDRRVVSKNGDQTVVSMSMKGTPWRKYTSKAIYTKYSDIFDASLSEFCYGSLIWMYQGATTFNKTKLLAGWRVECQLTLQTGGL
jgi:hypothetical protein